MDINTQKEMKKKLHLFYRNKIENSLQEYETKRKKSAIMQSLFILPFVFSIIFILGSFLPEPFREKLLTFSFLVILVSMFLLFITGAVLGEKTTKDKGTISHTLENELKQKFMKELLEIFLQDVQCGKNLEAIDENNKTQYDYSRNVINLDVLFKFQKKLRELKIFNAIPFLIINDCIAGKYDNVRIKIYEASTKPTTFSGTIFQIFTTIMVLFLFFPSLLFLIVMIIMTSSFFAPFLIFLIVLFALFIWFIYKLIKGLSRYSPFQGLIIEFDFEKSFENETFFLERSPASKKIKPDNKLYKRVKLESIYFEKQYQLYSNNQIEARYIFTPAFIEKINKIRNIYRTNRIRGSFKNNKFILTINTNRDMFALGSDFKKTNYKTFIIFYKEMISILQLVVELKNYLK